MEPNTLKAVAETLANASAGCQADEECCCCPKMVLFAFERVNCVNIFNGACTSWQPGSPCGPS
jgi:hypothetical protein